MVWSTLDDVQVIVGTSSWDWALVTREVLIYTTCNELGVCEAL